MSLAETDKAFQSPEIDGVMQSLQDYELSEFSDYYLQLVDDATNPGEFSALREWSIATKLHEFNCLEGLITEALEQGAKKYDQPTLVSDYRSVIAQITELTGIDVNYVHRL